MAGTRTSRLLVIAYHYPPSRVVGAVRPSKLVQYLPAFGWAPIVVTATPSAGPEPAPGIWRVREWPHPLKLYQAFRERHLRRQGRSEERHAKASPSYSAMQRHPSPLGAALIPLLSVPDRELGWLPPAVWRAWRVAREGDVRGVFTSGPPFTCHLVGWMVKRLTGLPWVADFRDPWSLQSKYAVLRNRLSDLVEARLIHRVMADADRIVCVTARMTDEAVKEHPSLDGTKFVTIPSGFDPTDYIRLPARRVAPPPTVFAYVGTFYHGRTPEPFLVALRRLLDEGLVRPDEVRVRFIGLVDQAEGRPVADLLAELNIAHLVSLEGPVPRQEALRRTLESHVVLILNERHPTQVPYKLYEALAAGAVILNIGSGGAVADVLARTGRGLAVDYRSQSEIRRAILTCLALSREGDPGRPAPWQDDEVQAFNFERLAGRLAALLRELDGRRHGI